jgi:hypothetical protein
MDNSIIATIIGLVGTAIISLAIGYINLYKKVEINDERLSKLGLEKGDLHSELQVIKRTVEQIRDALLRDGKL